MRILVMYSWDDDTSQLRWNRMINDPELASFEIQQCFALASRYWRTLISSTAITKRLGVAIDAFRPDIVLFHTGAAFHKSPKAFAECVSLISQRYPSLRLGYERRGDGFDVFEALGVFENSLDMKAIELKVFGW